MTTAGQQQTMYPTLAERKSDREFVVTRTFDHSAGSVFDAWTKPEQLMRWWAPKSMGATLAECNTDVRVGGRYRFVFSHPDAPGPMEFFGRYLEVTPGSRLVWTNEEGGEGGQVTTVSLADNAGRTVLVMHDLYGSKEALDEAIGSGSTSCFAESFQQLDELLASAE